MKLTHFSWLLNQAKRVSKKYERKAYNGKALYNKAKAELPAHEKQERVEKLKELENKFRASRSALYPMHSAVTGQCVSASTTGPRATSYIADALASLDNEPPPALFTPADCCLSASVQNTHVTKRFSSPRSHPTNNQGIIDGYLWSTSLLSAPFAPLASSSLISYGASASEAFRRARQQQILRQRLQADILRQEKEQVVLKEWLKRKFLSEADLIQDFGNVPSAKRVRF